MFLHHCNRLSEANFALEQTSQHCDAIFAANSFLKIPVSIRSIARNDFTNALLFELFGLTFINIYESFFRVLTTGFQYNSCSLLAETLVNNQCFCQQRTRMILKIGIDLSLGDINDNFLQAMKR